MLSALADIASKEPTERSQFTPTGYPAVGPEDPALSWVPDRHAGPNVRPSLYRGGREFGDRKYLPATLYARLGVETDGSDD